MKRPLIYSFTALLLAGSTASAETFSGASNVVNYDLRGKQAASVAADYDGDGVVDTASVRSLGLGKALSWSVALSSTGETVTRSVGTAGNKVLAGCDLDGDSKADMVAVSPSEINYLSSASGKETVIASDNAATDYSCWDTDGSGADTIVASGNGQPSLYRAAKALSCGSVRELGAPYLWKSSTSSHVPKADIRQKFKGSFIGKRRASQIPASSTVKMYDRNGNIVGHTCKYAQLGNYQFRYYNGTCGSSQRATTQTQRSRAVKNTGSPAVFLDVGRNTCLRLSNGPTTSRQGSVR